MFSKITWLQIHSGAYREGYSTELLLVHLSEIWRTAIDANKVGAAAFVNFRNAFDCVSHAILLHKLNSQFGVQGSLLSWLTDYLTDRTQFSEVNCQHLTVLIVTCGIPQDSVLGLTLFALHTGDLPSAVTSGSVFMYADDTTVYCIGTEQLVPRDLFNLSLGKVGSYALGEKTAHWAAKFRDYWRELDRVGETLVFWALLSMTGFPGHITLQTLKGILLTSWTSWKGVRS